MNGSTAPRFGDIRMCFHATAHDLDGQLTNGGQLYADSYDTPDTLRVWAVKMFANDKHRIGHVTIYGREMRLSGCWTPTGRHRSTEMIERDRPIPLTRADQAMTCYTTCVMDYAERVHERRSDNSCKCGKYLSRFPTEAPAIDVDQVARVLALYAELYRASDDAKPAARTAYARAHATLTVADQAALDALILDHIAGRPRVTR
jgi:hypothetical protein